MTAKSVTAKSVTAKSVTAKRPQAPNRRADRFWGGATAAALALSGLVALAAPAQAATFDLRGGAVIDGDIIRFGERFFVLSTALGYQVLGREQVRAVSLRVGGGAVESGALSDWRAGVYQLTDAKGALVIAREGAMLARRAAAGGDRSAPDAGSQRAAASTDAPLDGAAASAQGAAVAATMSLRDLNSVERSSAAEAARPTPAIDPRRAAARDAMSPGSLLSRGAQSSLDVRAALTSVILGGAEAPEAAPSEGRATASPAELDSLARASLRALSGSGAPAASAELGETLARGLMLDAPPPIDAAAAFAAQRASGDDRPAEFDRRARLAVEAPPSATGAAGDAVDPFADRRLNDWPLASAYLSGVLGRVARRHEAGVCAALAQIDAPLGRGPGGGANDAALIFGAHHGLAPGALAAIAQAYFAEAEIAVDLSAPSGFDARANSGVDARAEDGPSPIWVARQTGAISLLRPLALSALQMDVADLAAMSQAGRIDVAIGPRALASGHRARLVAFEPLAVAAHPDSGLDRMSLSTLRLLVSGGARKMGALGAGGDSAATLYLPPTASAEAAQLRGLLGVERIQPYSARFIADPAARIAAAAADPDGLVIASGTLIGSSRALAIGEPGAEAARPELAAMRSGAYTLVRPLYLISQRDGGHPLADAFADFLDGEAAREAMSRVGLLPASACADGDCRLAAPGLSAAVERAGTPAAIVPHGVLASPAADTLAEFAFSPARLDYRSQVAALDAYLREGPKPSSGAVTLRLTPMQIATDRIVTRDPAINRAIAFGQKRAEALALALRCAEIEVEGVTRPQGAPSEATSAWRIEIVDAIR